MCSSCATHYSTEACQLRRMLVQPPHASQQDLMQRCLSCIVTAAVSDCSLGSAQFVGLWPLVTWYMRA